DLKFSNDIIKTVVALIRCHRFFPDLAKVTLRLICGLLTKVAEEHINNLLNLRICDRIGTGRPKEQPFRLRKYMSMVDEAMRDPVTVGMLKIDGRKVMEMGEKPGPRIGWILHALLEEVMDEPVKNSADYLEKRAGELMQLDEKELKEL